MKQKQRRAGAPNENAKTSTGSPLIHTRYVENELLVNKNNPIQNSIKQYTYEMKKTTKRGTTNPDDVGQKKTEPVKPNDLGRLAADLKTTADQGMMAGPRAQNNAM
jgi:hypothetical protein